MLTQLKEIYPSLILLEDHQSKQTNSNQYQWFITPHDGIIGIPKDDLTTRDLSLLYTFLTPYAPHLPQQDFLEKEWDILVHGNNIPKALESISLYRFIYFTFPINRISPHAFKEAIHDIFAYPIPILWVNDHTGIIIENGEEAISYETIVDILMSDLYVNIHFLLGPFMDNIQHAKSFYHSFTSYAKTLIHHSDKAVITYTDTIPNLLVRQTEPTLCRFISNIVLRKVLKDKELLHTIQVFMDCNLNVTQTAKKLYMHRNSLQYRIDKFIEQTGIDIRQFHQAMSVQLAILASKEND